jgi:hypothetical protein
MKKEVAMGSVQSNRNQSTAADDMSHVTSLTCPTGIMRTDGCSELREPGVTASHPRLRPFLFDFIGREPFGFVFTAGHEARFHVPSGHRFVVEQVNIACWAKDDHLDVQLVTKYSSRWCNPTQALSTSPASPDSDEGAQAVEPIWVQGSSVSTFLFSNAEVHDSSIVPPDTYVQVWGYLEPTNVAASS